MRFKKWLKLYELTDSPVGDIARDILRDKEFPNCSEYEILYSYLKTKTNDVDVLSAFKMAHKLFCRERNKKKNPETSDITLVLKVGVNSTLNDQNKPVYYGEYSCMIPRLDEIQAIRRILDYHKNTPELFEDLVLASGIVDALEGEWHTYFEEMKKRCPELYVSFDGIIPDTKSSD